MFDDENEEIDPEELPIYKKGMEIFEVVDQICQLINDDYQHLGHIQKVLFLLKGLIKINCISLIFYHFS